MGFFANKFRKAANPENADSRNHGSTVSASYKVAEPYKDSSTLQRPALPAYNSIPAPASSTGASQPVKAQHNAVSSLLRSFSGAKTRGASASKGPGQAGLAQQQTSENEKLREENRGLRAKIDEVWEEKTQLKNNLKIQKDTIQKLMDQLNRLKQQSLGGNGAAQPWLLKETNAYEDGELGAVDPQLAGAAEPKAREGQKRNVSIKDKIVWEIQRTGPGAPAGNAADGNQNPSSTINVIKA